MGGGPGGLRAAQQLCGPEGAHHVDSVSSIYTSSGASFGAPDLGVAAEATSAKPFAMGLTRAGLDAFAIARGATTWKQLPDQANWRSGVLQKLADPQTQVHFNLDGVNVWPGLSRAASGRAGPTDWELLTIQQNPQFWGTLQFWKGGQPAANPFQ